jgi:mannose-6-phosphate isomerase-like protein (cupin superfamily)
MTVVVDLASELDKLTMLEGRTPTSTEADRAGAFGRLAPYRDGAIFLAKFSGISAWERHPRGDEIVQVLDGETELRLLTDAGRQSLTLKRGMMVIVPQHTWHQFVAPNGVSLMTATPQPTEHLRVDVDDPRTVAVSQEA